jgi:hypothetical protein
VNGARDGDLCANLNKNRQCYDTRGYIDQRHRECEERELRHRAEYDRMYAPPAPSTASWNARNATASTSRIGVVPNTN